MINFDAIKGFLDLSLRQRNALKAIVGGQHFTTSCNIFGLNPARTKKNAKFMAVLYSAQTERDKMPPKGAEPAAEPEALDIYVQAAELQKKLDEAYAAMTPEQRMAHDATWRAKLEADRAAELKAKLVGRVCRGCARPAELEAAGDFYCRACREIPKPESQPSVVDPPTPVANPAAPAPTSPPGQYLATRASITEALLAQDWQEHRQRESTPPRKPNWLDDGINCLR